MDAQRAAVEDELLLIRDPPVSMAITAPLLKQPSRRTTAAVHAHSDWKYCHYVNDIPELFNLRDDPREMRNLAAVPSARERCEQMRSEIIGLEAKT